MAGLVAAQASDLAVRTGVMWGPGTTALVTGTSATGTMTYAIGIHHAVTTRGTADGVYMGPTLDTATTVPTTAAPGSNSRIDIIYVKQNDTASTISADSGSTQPLYGVANGTAAVSPTAPSIPVGAIELARATVAAGATSTNGSGVTITNTAVQTVARGARVPVRSQAERDALTQFLGLEVYRLDTGNVERSSGTAWKITSGPGLAPQKFTDAPAGATFAPPGPITVHPSRTIDPAALFGPGVGALVMIDAQVLLDSVAAAATKWDLKLATPALSTTFVDQDGANWTGRGTLRVTFTDVIAAGSTASYSTFLDGGVGASVQSFADSRNNRAQYTVFPIG